MTLFSVVPHQREAADRQCTALGTAVILRELGTVHTFTITAFRSGKVSVSSGSSWASSTVSTRLIRELKHFRVGPQS